MKISKTVSVITILFTFVVAISSSVNAQTLSQCSGNSLGISTDFGLFVKNDITQSGSDTGGRVAAGNNITLNNYDVGATLSNSNGTRDDLIAGNTIKFTNGTVGNGNIKYGVSSNIFNVGVPHGTISQGNVIDFNAVFSSLTNESNYISSLTINGSATLVGQKIILNGTDSSINTFNITSAMVNSSSELVLQVPLSSTTVINFSGSTFSLDNYGFTLNGNNGEKILYNFAQASNLDIQAAGLHGVILAPNATVTFNNANIKGSVIASFISGNGQVDSGQIDYNPFIGCLINPTPTVTTTPPSTTTSPIPSTTPIVATTIILPVTTTVPSTSITTTTVVSTTTSSIGNVLGVSTGGIGGQVDGTSNHNINGLANTGMNILISISVAILIFIVLLVINNRIFKNIVSKILKR